MTLKDSEEGKNLHYTAQFKRDNKRMQKQNKDIAKLRTVMKNWCKAMGWKPNNVGLGERSDAHWLCQGNAEQKTTDNLYII